MGNHASLDIQFDAPEDQASVNGGVNGGDAASADANTHVAGNRLRGNVVLGVMRRKGIAPSSITVAFNGKEHTIVGTPRNTFRDEHIFVQGTCKLSTEHLITHDRKFRSVIPRGVHRIPFCFELPSSVPTTIKFPAKSRGVNARIEYGVNATYGDDNATMLQHNKALFATKTVDIQALPVALQERYQAQHPQVIHPTTLELKSFGMIHHGRITYAINVAKPVVAIGDALMLDLAIWKVAKVQLERVEVKISQYVTYKVTNDFTKGLGEAKEHERQKKNTILHWKAIDPYLLGDLAVRDESILTNPTDVNETKMQIEQQMLHDLASHQNKLQIPIPTDSVHLLDSYEGLLMSISHSLKVTIHTKNAMLKNPSCRIPIEIGKPLSSDQLESTPPAASAPELAPEAEVETTPNPPPSAPIATALSAEDTNEALQEAAAVAAAEQAPSRIPSFLRGSSSTPSAPVDTVPMAAAVVIDENNDIVSPEAPTAPEDESTVVLDANAVQVEGPADGLLGNVNVRMNDRSAPQPATDDNDDEDDNRMFFGARYVIPNVRATPGSPALSDDNISVLTHDIPETPQRRPITGSARSSSSSSSSSSPSSSSSSASSRSLNAPPVVQRMGSMSSSFSSIPPPAMYTSPQRRGANEEEHEQQPEDPQQSEQPELESTEHTQEDTHRDNQESNTPTLSSLLGQLAAASAASPDQSTLLQVFRGKMEDPGWPKFVASLSISDFQTILNAFPMGDRIGAAEVVAQQFIRMHEKATDGDASGLSPFTCLHCAAAMQCMSEYCRTDMLQTLLPYCSDIKQNHIIIREGLSDWERTITNGMFEEVLAQ